MARRGLSVVDSGSEASRDTATTCGTAAFSDPPEESGGGAGSSSSGAREETPFAAVPLSSVRPLTIDLEETDEEGDEEGEEEEAGGDGDGGEEGDEGGDNTETSVSRPVKKAPSFTKSQISLAVLKNIRAEFNFPESFATRQPLRTEFPDGPSKPREVALYRMAFVKGLRLPFPKLTLDLLRALRLAPMQLAPNAYHAFYHYVAASVVLERVPTVPVFLHMISFAKSPRAGSIYLKFKKTSLGPYYDSAFKHWWKSWFWVTLPPREGQPPRWRPFSRFVLEKAPDLSSVEKETLKVLEEGMEALRPLSLTDGGMSLTPEQQAMMNELVGLSGPPQVTLSERAKEQYVARTPVTRQAAKAKATSGESSKRKAPAASEAPASGKKPKVTVPVPAPSSALHGLSVEGKVRPFLTDEMRTQFQELERSGKLESTIAHGLGRLITQASYLLDRKEVLGKELAKTEKARSSAAAAKKEAESSVSALSTQVKSLTAELKKAEEEVEKAKVALEAVEAKRDEEVDEAREDALVDYRASVAFVKDASKFILNAAAVERRVCVELLRSHKMESAAVILESRDGPSSSAPTTAAPPAPVPPPVVSALAIEGPVETEKIGEEGASAGESKEKEEGGKGEEVVEASSVAQGDAAEDPEVPEE